MHLPHLLDRLGVHALLVLHHQLRVGAQRFFSSWGLLLVLDRFLLFAVDDARTFRWLLQFFVHGRPFVPIVPLARGSPLAHDFEGGILPVDVLPVMVVALGAFGAHFDDGRTNVPVVILALDSVFANNFLLRRLFAHLRQILGVVLHHRLI